MLQAFAFGVVHGSRSMFRCSAVMARMFDQHGDKTDRDELLHDHL